MRMDTLGLPAPSGTKRGCSAWAVNRGIATWAKSRSRHQVILSNPGLLTITGHKMHFTAFQPHAIYAALGQYPGYWHRIACALNQHPPSALPSRPPAFLGIYIGIVGNA